MITEKYCNEILQQYPEYITKDQMYRICHISKKTCLFLLESGLVPNIDSGKKTRRFKIKTVDVIQYLKDRDDYPELFKAPDGFYKGKGGDKKAPSFDEVFTQEDLIRIPIRQTLPLCDCDEHKRVQRYATTCRKAESEKCRLKISGSSRFRNNPQRE